MAPTPEVPPSSGSGTGTSSASDSMMSGYMGEASAPYHATPAAAVVVPVVLIFVIMVLAILGAYYLYRRRGLTDRDGIIAASTPKEQKVKRLPNWLTSWTGSIRAGKPFSGFSLSRTASRTSSNGSMHKIPEFVSYELSAAGNMNVDSDVTALRPTELPAAPHPAHEPRHPAFGFGGGVKPKSLAVTL